MRKPHEIKREIKALKALTPVGPLQTLTRSCIELQVDELVYPGGFDQTSGEWNELSGSERQSVTEALDWKTGRSDVRPSKGWKGYAT